MGLFVVVSMVRGRSGGGSSDFPVGVRFIEV